MSNNFINWLIGIGPNQFSIETDKPNPPRENKDTHEKEANETKTNDPDATNLGRPRG